MVDFPDEISNIDDSTVGVYAILRGRQMLTKRGDPGFVVRMPLTMREWIKAAAAENGRSMNSELVQVILEHMRREDYRPKSRESSP
jgi:hypothetical protein